MAATLAWAQPTRVTCGPGQHGCGPATAASIGGGATTTTVGATTTTTLTTLVLPGATGSDANCPTTIATINANDGTGWGNFIVYGQTCVAGANAAGYDVTAISAAVANAPAGAHIKCSIYDIVGPTYLGTGCNSAEATLTLNPNAYITMAVSGPCHLATATRYMIGCATDSGSVSWGTTTGGNIAYMGTSYATLWPTVLSQTGINAGIVGRYLTVTATPGTVVPACGPSDGNCPTTVPALSGTLAGLDGRANQTLSCATGAAAGGYTVRSISAYVGAATAGKHLQCSLYDTASPHARIGAGCDTVAATLVSPTNAYVTMATSGSCHVAASTRYTIVCNSDDAAAAWGYSASCPTCSNYDVQTYGTWPATLAASTAYGSALMYYMTVTSP